jgi:outer membrane cobalamin receptor
MMKVFLPARYVTNAPLEASRQKNLKGGINYRTHKGDTIGLELFKQTEYDALEYLDVYDPGKAMLTSGFRFLNEVERTGTSLKGQFKLENNFKFNIVSTWQKPENEANGQRVSYEPEKILDVGVNYSEGKWMVDFTRRAEFDRTARTPTTEFSAEDYSRSDLAVRYKMNNRFSAYLKIKDLYDEANEIRHNVPEEGRVTLAGIEAHF